MTLGRLRLSVADARELTEGELRGIGYHNDEARIVTPEGRCSYRPLVPTRRKNSTAKACESFTRPGFPARMPPERPTNARWLVERAHRGIGDVGRAP
jgi:hypothetical protein